MFKGHSTGFSKSTPNLWISEGHHPARHAVLAPYLPLIGYDAKVEDFKVIYSGKLMAMDSLNQLVPAGLAIDIETAIAATSFASCVNKYTATDVAEGVKNFEGTAVAVDEPVVASFFAGGVVSGVAQNAAATLVNLNNVIGVPLGMAFTDGWRQNGAGYGDGFNAGNPLDYTYQNYNLQQGLTLRRDYFIELPIVSNVSQLLVPGLTVLEGTIVPGDLLTFNARSNFIKLPAVTYASATPNTPLDAEIAAALNSIQVASAGKILGKAWFVDNQWPKDFMEYVRTWNPSVPGSDLTKVAPGSSTLGLPDHLVYAGQIDPATAKTAYINVFI